MVMEGSYTTQANVHTHQTVEMNGHTNRFASSYDGQSNIPVS